jgi:GNAT superfamily N-acetyltransferase
MNGVFTLPKARGHGIGQALIGRAIKFGKDEATSSGRVFTGSVVVHADNKPARALYEKCGFTQVVKEEALDGTSSIVVFLKYVPTSSSDG